MLLVVAGFIALFLAWNGAAGKDYVEGQLPYVISGGMVGLGLIGAGLTVVNVQARRADQAELLTRLEALIEAREDSRRRQGPARRPPQAPASQLELSAESSQLPEVEAADPLAVGELLAPQGGGHHALVHEEADVGHLEGADVLLHEQHGGALVGQVAGDLAGSPSRSPGRGPATPRR